MSERPEPTPPARTPLPRRLLRTAVALAVLAAVAAYAVVRFGSHDPHPEAAGCTVAPGSRDHHGEVWLAPGQAANAAAIAAVGAARGMPERAVTIALATAMQESALRNLDHGDRDSLGLFQQRPSQGWGTARQIMDPAYAAARFYKELAEVPGYRTMPLTEAAQRVQRSGYPQAYAKHEPDARLLAAAFTGHAPASLTCTRGTGDRTRPGDPAEVRRALVHDFGNKVLAKGSGTRASGTKPSGTAGNGPAGRKASGAAAGTADRAVQAGGVVRAAAMTARDTDRTVSVPVRGAGGGTDGEDRRGWTLAHWAVAHSEALGIERVGYAGREWTASDGGTWHKADGDSGNGKGSGQDGSQDAKDGGRDHGGEDGEDGADTVRIVTTR